MVAGNRRKNIWNSLLPEGRFVFSCELLSKFRQMFLLILTLFRILKIAGRVIVTRKIPNSSATAVLLDGDRKISLELTSCVTVRPSGMLLILALSLDCSRPLPSGKIGERPFSECRKGNSRRLHAGYSFSCCSEEFMLRKGENAVGFVTWFDSWSPAVSDCIKLYFSSRSASFNIRVFNQQL